MILLLMLKLLLFVVVIVVVDAMGCWFNINVDNALIVVVVAVHDVI